MRRIVFALVVAFVAWLALFVATGCGGWNAVSADETTTSLAPS